MGDIEALYSLQMVKNNHNWVAIWHLAAEVMRLCKLM